MAYPFSIHGRTVGQRDAPNLQGANEPSAP
jgi:hypothetical protein